MCFLGILSFQRSQHNPLFHSVTVETTWFLLCFAWRYTRSYYHSCSATWENSTRHQYSCVHFLRGWVCLQAVYQPDLCNITQKKREEHQCEVKSSWINMLLELIGTPLCKSLQNRHLSLHTLVDHQNRFCKPEVTDLDASANSTKG